MHRQAGGSQADTDEVEEADTKGAQEPSHGYVGKKTNKVDQHSKDVNFVLNVGLRIFVLGPFDNKYRSGQ